VKKVLFLALHRPGRAPGQRFRFEQYIPFLKEAGYDAEYSYLLSEADDKIFYSKGNYWKKFMIMCLSIWKRWKEASHANQYDLVFVQRECIMLGTIFFEKKLAKKTKFIYDFDDAIWLQRVSEGNKALRFLKDFSKTAKLIKIANLVFAGNDYLANYARQFNSNVVVIPTTIDTIEYQRLSLPVNPQVCIGWSGSFTTIEHFEFAIPALLKIKEKYGIQVCFKVIGDGNYLHEELGIQGLPWIKQDELKELSAIDIGIMPLPDDEWTNGKCGLKGLQYMALEIATIMSPVGVNAVIIQDGVNGYLAGPVEEWVDKISILIDQPKLRLQVGKNGRQTVLEKYSAQSQLGRYLQYFNELTKKP
jgi:glycosyltransferase involved in cell wall biosynthesis